jgi:hypothetical protein
MKFIEALVTLFRWKHSGWDVHPVITDEFKGWV